MCLAIPGKLIKKDGNIGIVNYGGIVKEIRLDFVNANVGDYILVHAGFAIEKIKKDVAIRTLEDVDEMLNG